MNEHALFAGAAKIDITPGAGCWMDGMARISPSDSILDRLYARCAVISSKGDFFIIISLELIGLAEKDANGIRLYLSDKYGISQKNIVIACTHTHSGPSTLGLFQPVEEGYLKALSSCVEIMVSDAMDRLSPAKLGTGFGEEKTISEYRRLRTKDGRIVMNWESFDTDEIAGPAGEPDHEVGVVKIVNSGDNSTIAVIFNHTGHPNVLSGDNLAISPDYPGHACVEIENATGGIALFLNGAQGSSDISGTLERTAGQVRSYGRLLAAEVLKIYGRTYAKPEVFISSANVVFSMAKREIDPQLLSWARKTVKNSVRSAVAIADGISDELWADQIVRLEDMPERELPFEIGGIAIDDSLLLALPAELFTETGLEIKRRSPFEKTMVIGLANGYQGYIPTEQAIYEGGYGSHPGITCRFHEKADRQIYDEAISLAWLLYQKHLQEVGHGKHQI